MHAGARKPETLIVEPVVPDYRVPFFAQLHDKLDRRVRIVACREIPGQPRSAPGLPEWAEVERSCIRLLGGRLLWQTRLGIPAHFGAGDVLVIDANPRYLSNLPLLLAAKRRGVGIVSWGHAWSPTSRMWRARLRFAYMKVADVILVYTDEQAQQLASWIGRKRPILATNNTIDSTLVDNARAQWPAVRLAQFKAAEGLDGRKVLLFCGRLRRDPPCGLETAIASLPNLRREVPEVLLVVIGTGELGEKCRRLAADLGVTESVRWLGEMYEEANIAPWFLAAEALVYPGAIGLALLHSFCYGLPVITHNQRHLHGPEIAALREGVNGVTFVPGDAMALTHQAAALLRDPEWRARLSRGALETMRTDYSMQSMVERFAAAVNLASAKSLQRRA